jgi:hypothetical protein
MRRARNHGVADEGVPFRDIAGVIGRRLNVPVVSKTPEKAIKHFGWFAPFAAIDCPASSPQTQERLGWQPKQPGLISRSRPAALFPSVNRPRSCGAFGGVARLFGRAECVLRQFHRIGRVEAALVITAMARGRGRADVQLRARRLRRCDAWRRRRCGAGRESGGQCHRRDSEKPGRHVILLSSAQRRRGAGSSVLPRLVPRVA